MSNEHILLSCINIVIIIIGSALFYRTFFYEKSKLWILALMSIFFCTLSLILTIEKYL